MFKPTTEIKCSVTPRRSDTNFIFQDGTSRLYVYRVFAKKKENYVLKKKYIFS